MVKRKKRAGRLAQRSFPALRSLLSPQALCADVQRAYGLSALQRCRLLRSLTNDVYEVAAADGRYILKVYGHGRRSAGDVAWELELPALRAIFASPAYGQAVRSHLATAA